MTSTKLGVIVGGVLVVLIAAFALSFAVGGDDTTPAGRITRMEQSGERHRMLQQHQDMLDRMRSDASPQMLRQMDNDPMTQMMRSGDMIRLMEQHQAEIDRMLGRTPGG